MPRPAAAPLADLSAIAPLLRLMHAARPPDVLGVCAAFFFHAAQTYPELLRPVLNEPIVKHGFVGQSLLSELTRVARG